VVTMFALAAALLYGSADFLGGVATRRARVLAVVPLSVLAGAVIVLAAALAAGEPVAAAGIGWGLAAGAIGAVGLVVFYSGLAAGPMTVVAPVSALVATVLPVGVALAEGERAQPVVYLGAILCLIAIVLVSSDGGRQPDSPANGRRPGRRAFHGRAVLYGATAGTTFGLFFLFLRYAGQAGSLWPVAAARLASLAVVMIAAVVTRTRPAGLADLRLLLATAGSGVLDASANVCYVLATRAGLFGLAVVLTALYPGITVLLARFALGERLRPVQRAGLLIAGIGVLLVTL
jgi:drug/metabolite transporter (DMT)-like permease